MATPLPPSFVVPATQTETRRDPLQHDELPPLFPEKITVFNIWKYLDYKHVIGLGLTPLIALYGLLTTEIQRKTLIWSIVYYYATGLGITAGYHRLWAHRAYTAGPAMSFVLALLGAGAVEGSIKWWSRGHRAHHRWTDTEKDPYSAHRGLFFSHIGWMLVKRPGWKIGHADVDDLAKNKLVQWQHKNYLFLVLFMGIIFPTLVAGLGWGDWRGGYFYAAILRLVFVHHATFCVNSLAHWLGDGPFDDRHSPRDHFITAFVTLGEGYHNFHHQFPQDYRNAIRFYQYDPTKWVIAICSFFGLASHLKTFPENEIRKGQLGMVEKKVLEKKTKLQWGTPISELPVMSFEDYQHACKNDNKKWILLEGVVYDVADFISEHPGGPKYLNMSIGKDMTAAFNGGMYDHSNAARNLLSLMRIAVVEYGGEVEAQKKNPSMPIYGQDHVKAE
ncbi:delta-9 fatty acid desaturase [Gamsiella multidivaricata]|uniref:delta-9 fatty acid desaturase n=1 Tax=Gamsiella multidivaricata TaxID=101098 RepID=UPI00221EFC2A|nr:delta-9 fatty acid desaturase [Gamsiella multidivaricata]KAI7819244.1 delta-9 fatty acid desaturase [Gamsiella multidivaricata]